MTHSSLTQRNMTIEARFHYVHFAQSIFSKKTTTFFGIHTLSYRGWFFLPVKDWDLFHPHFCLPKKHRLKHHFLTKKTAVVPVGKPLRFPHTQSSFIEHFSFWIRNVLFYAETAVFPHRPSFIGNVPLLLEYFFEEVRPSDDVDCFFIVEDNTPVGIFPVHRLDPFEAFFLDWRGQHLVEKRF